MNSDASAIIEARIRNLPLKFINCIFYSFYKFNKDWNNFIFSGVKYAIFPKIVLNLSIEESF